MKAMILNNNWWVKGKDDYALSRALSGFLIRSGFQVLESVEHAFEPHGYTRLWLLAESHLALHTFPEEDTAYVELSSCNEVMNAKFVALMTVYLKDG